MPQASCVNKTVLTFGIVEVILAIGLIGCGIFDIYFQSLLYYIGHGIWGGAFILLTATFAISAGTKQVSSCLHVTHMVLGILTCVLILPAVVILFKIEGAQNYDHISRIPYFGGYFYGGNNGYYGGPQGNIPMRDSNSNSSSPKSSLVQSFSDSAAQIKHSEYVYYANNPTLSTSTPSQYGSGSMTLDPAIFEKNDTIPVFYENVTECGHTASKCIIIGSTYPEVHGTDGYQNTMSEMPVNDEIQTTFFPRDTKTEIMATTTSIQPPTTTSPTNQMKTTFTALSPYNTNYPAPNAFDSTSPTSKVNDGDYYYSNNSNPDPSASYSPPNEFNNNYASSGNYNPDPAITYSSPNEYNNNYGGSYNGYNPYANNKKYGSSGDSGSYGSNNQYPNNNNYGNTDERGYNGYNSQATYGPRNYRVEGGVGYNGYNGYNGGGSYQNRFGGDLYGPVYPMQYVYYIAYNRSATTTALCAFLLTGFLYIVLILSTAFTCCAVCTCCGAKKNRSMVYPCPPELTNDAYPTYGRMNCGTATQENDVYWMDQLKTYNDSHQPLNMGYDPMHTTQNQAQYGGEPTQQCVEPQQNLEPQNVQPQENIQQLQNVDPLPQMSNHDEVNCVQHDPKNMGYNSSVSDI